MEMHTVSGLISKFRQYTHSMYFTHGSFTFKTILNLGYYLNYSPVFSFLAARYKLLNKDLAVIYK